MPGSSQPCGVSAGAPARTPTGSDRSERPSLRLVDALRDERPQAGLKRSPAPRGHADSVLVAGADPTARARMLAELRSLLPAGTDFREAGETWEVVAHACDSRMVVLAGDLGETSISALLRLLARRNPTLPVLAVGGDRRIQGPFRDRETDDGDSRPPVGAAHA